jgi:hypothetical protein
MLKHISKALKYIFGIAIVLNLGACASIVYGQSQGIFINTVDVDGAPVIGATCELNNIDGEWIVTTPNTVFVDKSVEDLNVSCTKNGIEIGKVAVPSSVQPHMMYGNAIFGGVLGAGIDTITGAAFEYPPMLVIKLKDETKEAAQ